MSSVYHVPLLLESQGIVPLLQRKLNLHEISIFPERVQKGADLHQRWKGITTGFVSGFDNGSSGRGGELMGRFH